MATRWEVSAAVLAGSLALALVAAASATGYQPDREVILRVEHLGCTLVPGVGCGHLLAPLLARVNAIPGVERSATNWTGTMIRVTASQPDQRAVIAGEVQKLLDADGAGASEIAAADAAKAATSEEWRGAEQVVELTSYEYRTHALRTVKAFAEREKLDEEVAAKLLRLVERQWDEVARTSGEPKLDAEAYAAYWKARRDRFITAVLAEAKALLSADQFARLRSEAPGR